jgi:cell division protein FtsL
MKTQNSRMPSSWSSLLRWPVFLAANLAVLLLVGVSTLRETYRGWTVDREIQALASQADSLEGRKLKLVQLADSFSSPDRVELDARARLGWKKDGERVVVLTGYEATSSWTGDAANSVGIPDEPQPLSNPARWWDYFFKSSNPFVNV